ncbi:hypothetical protein [Exiguobacterium algae]|uniref:hypothetical protein n=1 Tax=Exiguobacterium algae TaxID=2751250 RepID=UPI001BE51F5C|nr:hypothetical protein [Exiguobacterium algae]
MDVIGLLLWIGIFIAPFLGYRTGNKWLGRITMLSLIFLLSGLGYRLSGGETGGIVEGLWQTLMVSHLLLLALNSCLVSKRFVPEMTWLRLALIGFIGYGLGHIWIAIMTGTWEWMNQEVLTLSFIMALSLLLLVSLKTLDRRIEA